MLKLFRDIEGKKGELLATAVLKLLMVHSFEVREKVLNLIAARVGAGPIVARSRFASELEVELGNGNGPIDMLIETDDAVIGVENKLFAKFQDNQLERYQRGLDQLSEAIRAIPRSSHLRTMMVVLGPAIRRKEFQQRIAGKKEIAVVEWDELLEQVRDTRVHDNGLDVLLAEFVDYLEDQIGFLPAYGSNIFPFLHQEFVRSDNVAQRQVLNALWHYAPRPGRFGSGLRHTGYSLLSGAQAEGRSWLGFVSRDLLLNDGGADPAHLKPSELILVTELELDSDEVEQARLELVGADLRKWIGGESGARTYRVHCTADWDSPEHWLPIFAPFQRYLPPDDEDAG